MTEPSTDASGDVSNTTAPRTTSGNDAFSRLLYSKSIVEQIREVSSTAITSTDPKDYPTIHGRNGSRYMLEKWLDKRERRSWIGSHGFWLVEIDSAGKILRSMWCCSRCGNLFNSIATFNATIHLNKQHRVHESSEPSTATATATTSTSDIIIPRRKRGASTLAEMLRTNAVKRPKDPIFKTQADLFRHTFVNWIWHTRYCQFRCVQQSARGPLVLRNWQTGSQSTKTVNQ